HVWNSGGRLPWQFCPLGKNPNSIHPLLHRAQAATLYKLHASPSPSEIGKLPAFKRRVAQPAIKSFCQWDLPNISRFEASPRKVSCPRLPKYDHLLPPTVVP
ncbi:hypothetical protein M441DRAFT_75439, partial [Trichoderma asperellum CBS 433.97]